MTLIAKSIVKNEFWVVTDGTAKVGDVKAEGSGYCVTLGNRQAHFDTTKSIEKQVSIEFQSTLKPNNPVKLPYTHWPVNSKTYNNVFDVKRKIHIYTKTAKSKCYHVAGFFIINMNGEETIVECPKYIFIQRYDYKGPFKSKQEAEELLALDNHS